MSSIDFFYARPSCESCEKTRALLEDKGVAIRTERSTRDPLAEADVVKLLADVSEVWIARGRKIERKRAKETKPAELLGPTGKFRAPMLRRGKRLLVGFNAETVGEFLT